MSTDTETLPQVNRRQAALERYVILLSPTIGWWEGRYQLPKTDTTVSLSGKQLQKGVTTPRTVLITDEWPQDQQGVAWKKRFDAILLRKDKFIESHSEPFPIRGVRQVPRAAAPLLFRELFGLTLGDLEARQRKLKESGGDTAAIDKQIQDIHVRDPFADVFTPVYDISREQQSIAYEFYETTQAFLADLPNVVKQIREQIAPEVWTAIQHKVPKTRGEMRAKFHIDIVPVEIAGGTSPEEVHIADLEEHHGVVMAAVRRKVEEAVENLVAGPREQLADALGNLKELIERDGRVTEKSFRPVREAIAKIRLFDFVANEELMAEIGRLEQRMDVTVPKNLNSQSAAQNGFSSALDSLLTEVQDADRQAGLVASFGRELRGIQL